MADAIIRSIGGIIAEVTVKEQARDELTITNHPVERGAAITDHAFKNPATLTVQAGWSAAYVGSDGSGTLDDLYQDLLTMQSSATLLEVQTGKRLYENMLIKSLGVDTDLATENVMMVTISFQEVILVDTLETTMPTNSARSTPDATSGVANTGTKSVSGYSGALASYETA